MEGPTTYSYLRKSVNALLLRLVTDLVVVGDDDV